MYRALITDLDGSAVAVASNGSDVDKQTHTAVAKAISQGFKVACATGRDWAVAEPVIRQLGLISPSIVEGGTRIVNSSTGQTLWEKHLDSGTADKILRILKSYVTSGKLMTSANPTIHPLENVNEVADKLRYIYLLELDEQVSITIANQINTEQIAVVHLTPSWFGKGKFDLHVTHPKATKEHAIKVWQNMEGVSHDQTIGMGDSGNDVPIFMSSGLKVAVATATAELKELADYIAPSPAEHALEHVIKKFLITQ